MNKELFELKKTNGLFFIAVRGRFLNDICNIFGAISLNNLFKLKPILLQDSYPKNYFLFKYFGLNKTNFIFSYFRIFDNLFLLISSLATTVRCVNNLRLKGFDWLIDKFTVSNVKIGDLIYDTYIRKNHQYLNPKIDLGLCNIIFQSCYKTIKLKKFTQISKPKLVLIGTDGYAYTSGIIMRIALNNKIPTYEIQSNRILETKQYKKKFGQDHLRLIYNNKDYNFDKDKILNHYNFKKKNKKKIINYISSDTLFLANKNKYKNKKKIFSYLKIRNYNYDKIILLASHAFSDSPHIMGYQIFRDYYNHIFETLNFIKNSRFKANILWILKEHPASFLYKEKKIFKNLANKFVSEKIVLASSNINTYDLIRICDNVITTKGSIGLEFAAEGKKPILAGAASFSHLGFSEDPKNKDEYFKILRNIHSLKPLNKKQIFEAKKAIYLLDNDFHNLKLKDSNIISQLKAKKKYQRSILKRKINQDQNTLIKDTLRNLKKKNIIDDPYYKSVCNFFKKNI